MNLRCDCVCFFFFLLLAPRPIQIISFVINALAHRLATIANAYANTGGGLVLVGVSDSNIALGEDLTRNDVDSLLALFENQWKRWSPNPARECFSWKVWPVFSKKEIDTGVMVATMEAIFSKKDPRGMVWPAGCKVVLALTVAKSHCSMHEMIGEDGNCAYVFTRGVLEVVRPESHGGSLRSYARSRPE